MLTVKLYNRLPEGPAVDFTIFRKVSAISFGNNLPLQIKHRMVWEDIDITLYTDIVFCIDGECFTFELGNKSWQKLAGELLLKLWK